jgi:hypothetical protein
MRDQSAEIQLLRPSVNMLMHRNVIEPNCDRQFFVGLNVPKAIINVTLRYRAEESLEKQIAVRVVQLLEELLECPFVVREFINDIRLHLLYIAIMLDGANQHYGRKTNQQRNYRRDGHLFPSILLENEYRNETADRNSERPYREPCVEVHV